MIICERRFCIYSHNKIFDILWKISKEISLGISQYFFPDDVSIKLFCTEITLQP